MYVSSIYIYMKPAPTAVLLPQVAVVLVRNLVPTIRSQDEIKVFGISTHAPTIAT